MRPTPFLLCLAALLWALPPESRAGPEEESATRLASDATDFLDQLLGPGRAKVLVSVEGEVTELHTQSEVMTPILKAEDKKAESLPGYGAAEPPKKELDYMQKDMESSARRSGLLIKRMRISVLLDSSLSEAQVGLVRKVLPEFLHMSTERGDELSVLRAPLLPAWKSLWMTPEGLKAGAALASILLLGILLCVALYATAVRSARILSRELASRRGTEVTLGVPPQPAAGLETGAPLPELGAGGLPGLLEEEEPARKGLGHRFDFLVGKEPQETAELLHKESPEDLALLFAYLSDLNPDLASRVFSALPVVLQKDTSQALVRLKMADPERLAMLENRVKTNVEFGVRGTERLGRILSRLPAHEREDLLSELSPEEAENVERSLLPFESIGELKTEDLRRLIVRVPYGEWGSALRGAPSSLVERILAELPAGGRVLLQESLETPQPRDKVMECRSKILSQAFQLAAKGQIALGRQGASPELI